MESGYKESMASIFKTFHKVSNMKATGDRNEKGNPQSLNLRQSLEKGITSGDEMENESSSDLRKQVEALQKNLMEMKERVNILEKQSLIKDGGDEEAFSDDDRLFSGGGEDEEDEDEVSSIFSYYYVSNMMMERLLDLTCICTYTSSLVSTYSLKGGYACK